ncbi:hypothetical protein ATZ36_11215 [Candidatus Endomicrobiellum trichonymphae]|uniref:Uncharacterized protein n=1 Tax=Endomicrobium trichonymphae TaxID=1408204 RepID=A0A1E5IF71_ENDTX|nr:hypothetical protein ATZ36_11215 [Candidatus Endomicrobium trichonymphae]
MKCTLEENYYKDNINIEYIKQLGKEKSEGNLNKLLLFYNGIFPLDIKRENVSYNINIDLVKLNFKN